MPARPAEADEPDDDDSLTRPYQAVPMTDFVDDDPEAAALGIAASPLARASAHVGIASDRPASRKKPTAVSRGRSAPPPPPPASPGAYTRSAGAGDGDDLFDDLRPVRRGALPQPSKAQPVRPKPSTAAAPRLPTSLGAAGLPRGMRAPDGVPRATPPQDTDVLIAAVAAELIELHPEPEPEPKPKPEPKPTPPSPKAADRPGEEAQVAGSKGAALSAEAVAALEDDAEDLAEEDDDRRGVPWLFVGLAAAAAVVLAILLAQPWTGTRDHVQTAPSAAADARVEDNASGHTKVADATPSKVAAVPDAIPQPDDPPGPDAAGGSPKLDVGTEEEPVLELDDGESVEEVALDAAGPPPTPAPTKPASPSTGSAAKRPPTSGNSHRPRTSGKAARMPPRPKTSKTPPAAAKSADANTLLANAKAALSKGKASTAYSLASRSNSKKKTQSALKIMARAACRMGSKSKAKSAFDRLSLGARKGIRSECRSRGVRLGL